MTFASIDDKVMMHPKFKAVGPAAAGLWLRCHAYECAFGTQGMIPEAMPLALLLGESVIPGVPITGEIVAQLCDALVRACLWERVDDGWMMHDWDDWNLSPEERQRRQTLAKKRVRKWRARQKALKEEAAAASKTLTAEEARVRVAALTA